MEKDTGRRTFFHVFQAGHFPNAPTLQIDINDFSVLIDGAPQIVLDPSDLDEYFIDIEGITKTVLPAFQTSSIPGPKFITPQADRFVAYDYTSFSEQIFNISMTKIESKVEPYSVLNNFRWGSIAFVQGCWSNHQTITV